MNGIVLGVILALAWGAVNTPAFHAREVRLSGTVRLTRDAVLSRAGIGPTTNVLRTSARTIEARLEQSPWILGATVTRELPATFVIRIEERHPVAALRSGAGWAVLAEDAVVLALRTRRPKGLPIVEQPARGETAEHRSASLPPAHSLGSRVEFARPFARVLAGLPATVHVVSVRGIEGGGSELRLAGTGTRVRFGDANLRARKNAALVALLRWVRGQGRVARMIDVRVPESPAVALAPVVVPA